VVPGTRDRTLSAYLRFSFFDFCLLNFAFKGHEMRRIPLAEATMQGWARLDAAQRQRFFEAFLKAALRLDALPLRAWLRRRLKNPLAEPIDPARLIFGDAGIASLLRAAGKAGGALNRHDCRVSPGEFHSEHRVAGGSRPPPAPTERSMRIYRTTLFGS
jgi:hypothetical protein